MKIKVSSSKRKINEIENTSWQYKKTKKIGSATKDKLNNLFGTQSRVVKKIDLSAAESIFDAYHIQYSGRKVNDFFEGMIPQLEKASSLYAVLHKPHENERENARRQKLRNDDLIKALYNSFIMQNFYSENVVVDKIDLEELSPGDYLTRLNEGYLNSARNMFFALSSDSTVISIKDQKIYYKKTARDGETLIDASYSLRKYIDKLKVALTSLFKDYKQYFLDLLNSKEKQDRTFDLTTQLLGIARENKEMKEFVQLSIILDKNGHPERRDITDEMAKTVFHYSVLRNGISSILGLMGLVTLTNEIHKIVRSAKGFDDEEDLLRDYLIMYLNKDKFDSFPTNDIQIFDGIMEKFGYEYANSKPISYIVFSRVPIDIVRMSDFSELRSCHGVGGLYASCATQEAISTGGAVGYLFGEKYSNFFEDAEYVNALSTTDQEFMQDDDRNVDGIIPTTRIRIRTWELTTSKDEKIIIHVPTSRMYGKNVKEFYSETVKFLYEKQADVIQKLKSLGTRDIVDAKLYGGAYGDAYTPEVDEFLGTSILKSFYSFKRENPIDYRDTVPDQDIIVKEFEDYMDKMDAKIRSNYTVDVNVLISLNTNSASGGYTSGHPNPIELDLDDETPYTVHVELRINAEDMINEKMKVVKKLGVADENSQTYKDIYERYAEGTDWSGAIEDYIAKTIPLKKYDYTLNDSLDKYALANRNFRIMLTTHDTDVYRVSDQLDTLKDFMVKFYKEELTVIHDDPDQEGDIIEMIIKYNKETTPVSESKVRIRLNRR